MIEVNVSDDAEVDLIVNAEHYESKEAGLGLFFDRAFSRTFLR